MLKDHMKTSFLIIWSLSTCMCDVHKYFLVFKGCVCYRQNNIIALKSLFITSCLYDTHTKYGNGIWRWNSRYTERELGLIEEERERQKKRERSDVGPWLMRLSQLCLCCQMCAIVLSKDSDWESQCTADKFIPCYSAVEWDVCVCVCLLHWKSIYSFSTVTVRHTLMWSDLPSRGLTERE